MSGPGSDAGAVFAQTATGTTSAVATQAANANGTSKIYITDISGSSDLAGATIIVKAGSTTIWQDRVSNTGAYVMNLTTPLVVPAGQAATITVTGTSLSNANFAGYVY